MAAHALICGIVRNVAECSKVLRLVRDLQADGTIERVVVSTWSGQDKARRALKPDLKAISAEWIESQEPPFVIRGHLLHQMKSLYLGLSQFDDEDVVLKLRTDKVDERRDFRALVREFAALPPAMVPPFRRRIAVIYALAAQPFWFGDVQYLGLAADLRQLVSFDIWFEMVGCAMAAEQVFFSTPFLRNLPWITPYFYASPCSAGQPDSILLSNPLFQRAIHDALCILRDGYWLGDASAAPRISSISPGAFADLTLPELLWDEAAGRALKLGHMTDRGLALTNTNDHQRIQLLLDIPISSSDRVSLSERFGNRPAFTHADRRFLYDDEFDALCRGIDALGVPHRIPRAAVRSGRRTYFTG
jgi:hypothetical protein